MVLSAHSVLDSTIVGRKSATHGTAQVETKKAPCPLHRRHKGVKLAGVELGRVINGALRNGSEGNHTCRDRCVLLRMSVTQEIGKVSEFCFLLFV